MNVIFLKTFQVHGNLNNKLTYKPYPRDEFKNCKKYLKAVAIAFDSPTDTNLMCNITSNCVFSEAYNLRGEVETYQQVLQCFKLTTRNNDGGLIRFTNSEWFYITNFPNELNFFIENMKTKKNVVGDINIYLTIAFGEKSSEK